MNVIIIFQIVVKEPPINDTVGQITKDGSGGENTTETEG